MKELSIEGKAKLYDEAIERVNKLKNTCDAPAVIGWCKYIFPELKESEDERIRKSLIDYLRERKSCESYGQYVLRYDHWIAWLERQGEQKSVEDSLTLEEFENAFITKAKQYDIDLPNRSWDIYALCKELYSLKHKPKQGEQKSADKVEPKFKTGQWIVWQDKCYKVNYNGCGYELVLLNGLSTSLEYGAIDESAHLWTIEDAKDGDVLCTYECGNPKIIFILKGTPKKPYVLRYYCYYNIMYPYFESDSETGCIAPNEGGVKPATKEQCDQLRKAMFKADYEWDAENRELKKL